MMAVPLLVDTDPGIDDALALLLAFRSPGATVGAVTTVAGNVPVTVATRNVARILGVVHPDRPPVVAVGAAAPRVRPLVTATHIHGEDGLGGLSTALGPGGGPRYPEAPVRWHPRDAADLIVESARRWAAELVIVALGPLTNLARAVELDLDALRRVRTLVVMGGAVAVGGNITAAAEFNMFVDPESAARVLTAGLPLTLVPLDVTREVVWAADAISRFGTASNPIARFAADVGERGLALAGAVGGEGITMHDPLAVGVALDPTLVQTADFPVAVETEGALTRGATVVDRRRPATRRPVAGVSAPPGPADSSMSSVSPMSKVALRVDAARFLKRFEEALCL